MPLVHKTQPVPRSKKTIEASSSQSGDKEPAPTSVFKIRFTGEKFRAYAYVLLTVCYAFKFSHSNAIHHCLKLFAFCFLISISKIESRRPTSCHKAPIFSSFPITSIFIDCCFSNLSIHVVFLLYCNQ